MNGIKNLKFNEQGLIPVIVQEKNTKDVLMLAYANEEAIMKTIETKKAHYFSRSRNKLWLKGEESGNIQNIDKVQYDCDEDTLLYIVEQSGGAACHTGRRSCFFNTLEENQILVDEEKVFNEQEVYGPKILKEIYNTIVERRDNPVEGSYTNYLFEKGIDKTLKKVGEEAAEVIIAAKNEGNQELIYEASDLLYHLMVLLVQKDTSLEEIYTELKRRKK